MESRFGAYTFQLIQEIRPDTNEFGIIEITHELDEGVRLNSYASGPFCRIRLAHAPPLPGVYALTTGGGSLQYLGECESLAARFGPRGYGEIAQRNIHKDGQSTNCKINALILQAAKRGERIELWFHSTHQHKKIEADLIAQLQPPWNGRQTGTFPKSVREPADPVRSGPAEREMKLTADVFRRLLKQQLAVASTRGDSYIRVRAGDLHRLVGGYPGKAHRMPVCCSVMRSMMLPNDILIQCPPKGAGANLIIEYTLPRR